MALKAGSKLGPYEIVAPIGAGGMGEVYLARDSKLDREIAIKVLPELLTRDPERVARFEREAKLLASLNHPNIAAIYGFDDASGTRFLVMEYVEGGTLAQRLKSGAFAVEDALDVAKQMAEALEAAHKKGVIHRDLKPGNVMIRPDGSVKVLDFGLAKAMAVESSASKAADSPTITNYTRPGVVLGTAAYMSPEQARGRPLDKRTDIWSFGVVLYEMLTGVGPFQGESVTDSVGAILHKEVDLDKLPPRTSAALRRVLNRCLAREIVNRYRDIGDVRLDLDAALNSADDDYTLQPKRARWKNQVVIGSLGLLLGATIAAISLMRLQESDVPRVRIEPRRYSIRLPDDAPLAPAGAMPFGVARPMFDLSRDGRLLVYVALVDGETHLYLLDLSTGSSERLRGTAGGFGPFFSPDGRQIGFFAKEKLFKLFLNLGGSPEVVAGAGVFPFGGFWGPDGNIYFAPSKATALVKVPAGGGRPTPVTQTQVHGSHRWPHLLPDDETLLFTAFLQTPAIGVVRTNDVTSQRILSELGTDGRYTSTGHLVFVRGDRLAAVGFDLTRLEVKGDPVTLITGLQTSALRGQFALSEDGTLVYAEGTDSRLGELVWVDREGRRQPLGLGLRRFVAFRLSPDGKRLAVPIHDGSDQDIWVYDLSRLRTPTRITFGGYHNGVIWTDDSRFLIYTREFGEGGSGLRAKDLLLGGDDYEILRSSTVLMAMGYDAERKELLFCEISASGMFDQKTGVIDLAGASGAKVEEVKILRGTPYNDLFVAYSPDKKWIALRSDETGRSEIYLEAYPTLDHRIQVSTGGGEEPLWTSDGKRIIYRWGPSWYEVEVSPDPEPTVTVPQLIASGPFINVYGYSWDMTPDGERLLLIKGPDQDRTISELKVVTNFFEEIVQRCSVDD